jgi:hypothetical protein
MPDAGTLSIRPRPNNGFIEEIMINLSAKIARSLLGGAGCLSVALICAQPAIAQSEWRAKGEKLAHELLPKDAKCEKSADDDRMTCEFPVLRDADPRPTKYWGNITFGGSESHLLSFGVTKWCKAEDQDKCRSTNIANDPELKRIVAVYETIIAKTFALDSSPCAQLGDEISHNAVVRKVNNAAYEFRCMSFLFDVKAGQDVIIEGAVAKNVK